MLSLRSPAKINLFLRILYLRPDGYHELASLFQTIDLCDRIHVEISKNDRFTCSDPSLLMNETNLVVKAVRQFRKKTGVNTSFALHLEKNIPMQAGLGGGSSNAATTLWALNVLSGKAATEHQLAKWGAEIGSDVPFFFSYGTAYCTGRGENFRLLPKLENLPLWIIKPQLGLSTPQVYNKLDIVHLAKRDPEKILQSFLEGIPEYFNDLEPPAFELLPELGFLKQKLVNLGFFHVLMSGSGSSFFCIGDVDSALLKDYLTFQVNFLNREQSAWY